MNKEEKYRKALERIVYNVINDYTDEAEFWWEMREIAAEALDLEMVDLKYVPRSN